MVETAVEEMVDITVKVPVTRLPHFYEMFGKWLSYDSEHLGAAGTSDLVEPWSSEDVDLLMTVVKKMSKPARRLLDLLACDPGTPWTAEGLAGAALINNGKYGIAGTLAWPGKYCKSINRPLPLEIQSGADGQTLYLMTEQLKDLYEQTGEAFHHVRMRMRVRKEGRAPQKEFYFVDETS